MIRTGVVGLGKMGVSHCSIINAHPDAELTAVCDTSKFVLEAFRKYSKASCHSNYRSMIQAEDLDCVFVASPTKLHHQMVMHALENNLHVFCEKPFMLKPEQGEDVLRLLGSKSVVNQVGYNSKFIGTFRRAKELLEMGAIGKVYHFVAETYGPVVTKKKSITWRSSKDEGGGCLYDYAAHTIDLVNYLIGKPRLVTSTMLKRVYSHQVEDAVYSTLDMGQGVSGYLSVNWSDETYRKITTQLTIVGDAGKIVVDNQEFRIYVKKAYPDERLVKGWNVSYITDLALPVNFYLRGEEYSAQIDYFFESIKANTPAQLNDFKSAFSTDEVIQQILTSVDVGRSHG